MAQAYWQQDGLIRAASARAMVSTRSSRTAGIVKRTVTRRAGSSVRYRWPELSFSAQVDGSRQAYGDQSLAAEFGIDAIDLFLQPALAPGPVDGHVTHEVLDVPGGFLRVNLQTVMGERIHYRRSEVGGTGVGCVQSYVGNAARLVEVTAAVRIRLCRRGAALLGDVDTPHESGTEQGESGTSHCRL